MNKMKISICSSPTCHIEGARLFKQLDTVLSARIKENTCRTGTSCPGFCKNEGINHAPCAMVGSNMIVNATPSKILKALSSNKAA